MNSTRSLFPGAMGPHGFISCFDQLLPEAQVRRRIVLKGGPGVGKSTFMRRVHAALCPSGEDSTLCFCSGDPDSLDAVVVPDRGFIILDGTAPHIVDPEIPGARDGILNLGAYLDEPAMRQRLSPIRQCMEEHALASKRARACMRAAETLSRNSADLVDAAIDQTRMTRMIRELVRSALAGDAAPSESPLVRTLIADAVTPKGEMSFIAENARPRVIRIVLHWAMDPTPILRSVSQAAQARGLCVEEYLAPCVPGRLLHVAIPALQTLVTTSDLLSSEQTFDFAACVSSASLMRQECALEQNRAGIRMHTHRAVSAMAQAKQLHDELETFYVPNMDFGRWQKALDETLQTL